MYVGLAKLSMWFDGSSELKYKKSVVQKIKSRLKANFNLSIAQVDKDPEEGDFVTLGFAVVGHSSAIVDNQLTSAINFLESLSLARVKEEKREIIYFDGED